MILEGRQNQVLRNLVYRLKKKPGEWKEFIGMVKPLFSLDGLNVPFDDTKDEWLTATYEENHASSILYPPAQVFCRSLTF